MPIGFLALLAIQIGIAILGRLLTGRIKRPKAQPFESPRVEEGATIPKFYGIQQVSGLVTLVKNPRAIAGTAADDTAITYYLAKMQMVLGWGEIDVLYDIISDERAVSLQVLTAKQSYGGNEPYLTSLPFPISHVGSGPARFRIAVRQMFGGNKEGGGLQGEFALYWGMRDQPIDPLVAEHLGEHASRYPYLAYAVFGAATGEGIFSAGVDSDENFYWSANTPTPRPISFLVGCYPCALLPKVTVLSGRVGGQDANPAEVIYDMLTNPVYGRGWSVDRFNLPQWQAKAQEYKNRGVGFSGTLTSQMTTEDFLDECQSHSDCLVVTNPLTGLLELKTLLPDYDPDAIPVITKKNTRNFHQGGGTLAKTLNEVEVKYRKFIQSANQTVEDELVDPDVDAAVIRYQAQSQNLTNLVVWRVRDTIVTDITGSDNYTVNLVDGEFLFFIGFGDIQTHDELHISYTGSTTFSGFVDASEKEQNLANWQATGSSRPEAYDYPWLTSATLARQKAIRLRKTVTRDLPVYKFEGNREFAHLTEGDVVRCDTYGLSGEIIRLTKIGYGTLASPWVPMEGVRDVWGEQLTRAALRSGGDPSVAEPPPVPPFVTVQCLGGAIRMGLIAQDSTYTIELYRAAADPGPGSLTGATLIAELPGSTLFYDDAQTVGTTWWYAARLSRANTPDGPLSAWVSCTASATGPGTPECVRPQIVPVPSQIDATGQLELVLTDPQGRIVRVEFQVTVSGVSQPRYTEDDRPPIATVDLLPDVDSAITFWVTSIDCDGTELVETRTIPFSLTPITGEEPPIGLVTAPFEIVGHRTGPSEWRFDGPSAAREILSPEFAVEDWYPLDGVARTRITYSIPASTCPVGSCLGWDYKKQDGTWGDLGPFIGIDPATIAAADEDGVMRSEWFPIPDDAAQDVRLRPMRFGGDGTGAFFLTSVALQGEAQAPDLPAPDPEPPTETPPTPSPCAGGTGADGMDGYVDVADFEDDNNWGVGHPLTSPEANPPKAHLSTTAGEVAGDQVLDIHVDVAGIPFGYSWSAKGPAGFPCLVGDALQLIVRCKGTRTDVANGFAAISQFSRYTTGGGQATLVNTNQSGDFETITINRTSNHTVVWAHIGMPYCGANHPTDHFIVETVELKINGVTAMLCGGSTGGSPGDGTTGAGGGDDPIPPPPPGIFAGNRPMGMWALPTAGWGSLLDLSVKSFSASNTPTLLAAARAAHSRLLFKAGSQEQWLDTSGKLTFARWKATFDAIWNNGLARAAILIAIGDGTLFGWELIDEPFDRHLRYGGVVPLALVEDMALYAKDVIPTLPTIVTGIGTAQQWWMTRHINGLDSLTCDYTLSKGDVTAYRDSHIAFAQDLGHHIALQPHYLAFDQVGSNRYITPAEVRHYGGIIHTPPSSGPYADYRTPFSFGWKFTSAMFAQAGWNSAIQYQGDLYTSFDLP